MARPYPTHTLEEVLVIPWAIRSNNAGLPFDRILLAKALGTTPASSGFTMKLNSSAKYGLTQGGYSDTLIELTPLGDAIVAPRDEDERQRACFEAVLRPELFRRFFRLLDGKRLPAESYAHSLIQRELEVHPDLSSEYLKIVTANGLFVGIMREVGTSVYVSFDAARTPGTRAADTNADGAEREQAIADGSGPPEQQRDVAARRPERPSGVYISHTGATEIVTLITQVLDQFGIAYKCVASDSRDSAPLTDEASKAMRSSSSGILVVSADHAESGQSGGTRAVEHMLCQLGAAYMLYGDRIVAVREKGLDLPPEFGRLHTLEFDRERPAQLGLPILGELHRVGVIQVTASTGAS